MVSIVIIVLKFLFLKGRFLVMFCIILVDFVGCWVIILLEGFSVVIGWLDGLYDFVFVLIFNMVWVLFSVVWIVVLICGLGLCNCV